MSRLGTFACAGCCLKHKPAAMVGYMLECVRMDPEIEGLIPIRLGHHAGLGRGELARPRKTLQRVAEASGEVDVDYLQSAGKAHSNEAGEGSTESRGPMIARESAMV
jgi:hypothetical protein